MAKSVNPDNGSALFFVRYVSKRSLLWQILLEIDKYGYGSFPKKSPKRFLLDFRTVPQSEAAGHLKEMEEK